MRMYRSLCAHSAAEGHLGGFRVLAIMNKAGFLVGVSLYLSFKVKILQLLYYVTTDKSVL